LKLVISDPKEGKAYSKKVEDAGAFLNKKIGQEVSLETAGLSGYMAKITGGSDAQGFPMKKDLSGTMRKKILLTKDRKKGKRIRVSVMGNTVSQNINQLNLVVTKYGTKKLGEQVEPSEEEKKVSAKEAALSQKLLSKEDAEKMADLMKKGKKK
jgi:small subunit ribosomal protein S6e